MSGRWNIKNNDNICINLGNINEFGFGINEVKTVIYYKKSGNIDVMFRKERILNLLNAFDYFTIKVDSNAFVNYFDEYVPAIKYEYFIDFKKNNSEVLLNKYVELNVAIEKELQSFDEDINEMNGYVISNWKIISNKLLVCNDYIATKIFCENFIYTEESIHNGWNQKKYKIIKFIQLRSENDMLLLWNYIHNNKLYIKYEQIFVCIYDAFKAFKTPYYNGYHYSVANILIKILFDLLSELMVNNDIIIKDGYIFDIIHNILHGMRYCLDSKFIDGVTFKQIYKTIFFIIDITLKARNNINCKHFKNVSITDLLSNNIPYIINRENKNLIRNLSQKITSIYDKLNNNEKHYLLKILLVNYENIDIIELDNNIKSDIKSLLKNLIQHDLQLNKNLSKNLISLWFPIMMHNQNWIINELPNIISKKQYKNILKSIALYISSVNYNSNPCSNDYIKLLNQYTNLNWNLS